MASYDAEIRVKTKVDNSEVIKLEADMDSAEKKAEDLGDALDQVALNKDVAESAQQASESMDALAQKTGKASAEAEKLDALFKNTKIHLANGTTINWDEEVIKKKENSMRQLAEDIRQVNDAAHGLSDDAEFNRLASDAEHYREVLEELDRQGKGRVRDETGDHESAEYTAAKNALLQSEKKLGEYREHMRMAKEEAVNLNREVDAIGDGAEVNNVTKQLTPMQNMLALIKKSFQDIPLMFSGAADSMTEEAQQMEVEWDNLSNKAANYKGVLRELESKGLGFGNQEYDEAYIQWQQAEQAVREYKAQLVGTKAKHVEFGSGLKRVGKSALSIFRKIGTAAKKFFFSTQKGAKKTSGILGTMASRMKGLLLSLLIFNWISKGFNAMIDGMKKGFDNLMKYSDSYANSVMSLRNAMSTLGNSFAAAFAPIVQTVIPYLVQLINWVNSAINAIAQLIAYLSGKSTWTKATQVQNGYKDSLNSTADAAKKAAGALAKFDDLDVLQKKEDTNAGGAGAGGTTGGFEEVPIDNDIKKFADKLKEILSDLFAPLKTAWEREGKFVMDSWEYALDECWNLIKDIGRDFLTMWNQEMTIQMFADILHIIGDIGLVIGNIANGLDEAWNKNQTGLHILENIRDIFGVIVKNIRDAADYTVEWSSKLNFTPLLESFEKFTDSLIPLADNVSGVLTDLYQQVLLPLGQWTLEKGLPELLDILTDFNNKVDWEKIRQNLSDFWDKLEPFAETVGEGLLIFLRDVSELVAGFLNSEKVTEFLDYIAEWMESVEPEDVAEAMERLTIAFLAFKAASVVLDGALAASSIIRNITEMTSALTELSAAAEGVAAVIGGSSFLLNLGFTADLFSKLKNGIPGSEVNEYNREIKELNSELASGKITQQEYETSVAKLQEELVGTIEKTHEASTGISFLDQALGIGKENTNQYAEALKNLNKQYPELESGQLDYNSVVQDALDPMFRIKKASEDASTGIETMGGALDTTKKSFDTFGEEISTDIESDMKNVGENMGEGLLEGFALNAATRTTIFGGYMLEIVDKCKEIFGIHSPSTVFAEIGYDIILGLLNGLKETWQLIMDWWNSSAIVVWWTESVMPWFSVEKWLELLENIRLAFETKWLELVEWWQNTALYTWWEENVAPWFTQEKWQELFENIRLAFEAKWLEVKENTIEQLEEMRKSIKEKMDLVKEKFDEVCKKLDIFKKDAKTAFESVKNNAEEFFTPVIENIQDFINKVEDAIKAVKDFLKSGWEKITGSFGSLGSNPMFAGRSAQSVAPASMSYALDSIPHLASGAVIRGGNPFVAMLGDQPHGQTNIEAPLATIRQAVREELSGLSFGGGSLKVTLQVNGSDLAQATVQDYLSELGKQGYDVEILGVT